MKILETGVAVVENDTHISRWVEQSGGKLECPDYILERIGVGDRVVDVGACIGDYTVPFARKVGSTGHVYAFEPNPEAYQCLLHNTAGMSNVTSACVGLANRTGFASICRHENLGASWLLGEKDGAARTVVTKLDLFGLRDINVIKIDAEGYEVDILRGACVTLRECRPTIILELNELALCRMGQTPADVVTLLGDMGYLVPDGWQGQPQIDIFATRK